MRLHSWVFVLLCLSVSLLLSQLSSASMALSVNEAATRLWPEENATRISLAVVNPSRQKIAARVRLEVLDPQGALRAGSETNETIKRGRSALLISLPLPLAGLDKEDRNQVLWYRLRYRISPEQTERSNALAPVEGIISLSEITPDLFELRVAAPDYAREGMHYHAQARAGHPVTCRARVARQAATRRRPLARTLLSTGRRSSQHIADGLHCARAGGCTRSGDGRSSGRRSAGQNRR